MVTNVYSAMMATEGEATIRTVADTARFIASSTLIPSLEPSALKPRGPMRGVTTLNI